MIGVEFSVQGMQLIVNICLDIRFSKTVNYVIIFHHLVILVVLLSVSK